MTQKGIEEKKSQEDYERGFKAGFEVGYEKGKQAVMLIPIIVPLDRRAPEKPYRPPLPYWQDPIWAHGAGDSKEVLG